MGNTLSRLVTTPNIQHGIELGQARKAYTKTNLHSFLRNSWVGICWARCYRLQLDLRHASNTLRVHHGKDLLGSLDRIP